MTKISKKSAYPVKDPVRKDYFVGTDSENNGKTVNFDFESTAKIISELNGNQVLNYRFRTDSNIDLAVLTEGVFLSAANQTTVDSISKIYINKSNFQETNISDLFRFVALNKEVFLIKLRNENNLNNALYLKITGATEYENYFTLDVAIYLGNATMPELLDYNIYFFDFELKSTSNSGEMGPILISDVIGLNEELSTKLDITDYNDRFKGVHLTESALNIAHPTANSGDSAQVNEVGTTDVVNYSWDVEESIWVETGATSSGATNTDLLPEGNSNLYFNTARVLATLLSGFSLVTGGSIVSTDSVLTAFGKLQKQISDAVISISLKASINSPTFTGVPLSPTAIAGTSTTQIANTQFVLDNSITLIGNQAISGLKSFDNGSNPAIRIQNTTSNADGSLQVVSTSSGYGSTFLNTGNGVVIGIQNQLGGRAIAGINYLGGVFATVESRLASTGDILQFYKDGKGLTFKVSHLGELTVPKITNTGIQEYTDNASAIIAGLVVGTHYRTGDLLKIVH